MVKYGFSPQSFRVSKDVVSHLQRQRRGFDYSTEDPKIHDRILAYQRGYLAHLIHPVVLKRMTDTGLYGNSYSVATMMNDLTNGIFSADLKTGVATPRQNLQVEFVNALISGLESTRYDHVARSAMLAQLMRIQEMMEKNKAKDASTKAHRAHISLVIEKALDQD